MSMLLRYSLKIAQPVMPVLRRLLGLRVRAYSQFQSAVENRKGLEIGGPSGIFRDAGALPLYRVVSTLDNCVFAGKTIWDTRGVLVDPRKAEVKVLAVHSYLDAGRVVQPDLLMGQYYGGVAMGVGYALLEELPQTYGGPGEGDWNLNRYDVPRWGDLPLDRITLELLGPESGEPTRHR